MKRPSLLTWPIFPLLLVAFALVNVALLERHWPAAAVSGATLVPTIGLLLLLERLLPLHRAWNQAPSAVDVALLLGNRLLDTAALALGVSLLGAVAAHRPDAAVTHLWPTRWPLLSQAALGLVVGELGRYGFHRLSHRPGFLWRVHRVHHSPERMYALNGPRLHPINQLLMIWAGPMVMLLLGAGLPSVVTATNLFAFFVLFQHSNVALRFDGANRIFMTADLHRWHHARGGDAAPVNFAIAISLVDYFFGTLRLLNRDPASDEIGLLGDDGQPPVSTSAATATTGTFRSRSARSL